MNGTPKPGQPEHPKQPSTPYQRMGGEPVVAALVDRFYQRVLADPELAPFFDAIDLADLRRHQRALIGQLLGGPHAYRGRYLVVAHADLGIRRSHFDQVMAHLVAACRDLKVPPDVIADVSRRVGTLEQAVVTSTVGRSG